MSLLNKFANVTIENTSRISKIDQEYCETQERYYKEALNALLTALVALKAVFNNYVKVGEYDRSYIEEWKDIKHMEDRMKEVKNDFISKIVGHFKTVYNVTLESGEIKRKYDLNVTYQNVVDEIFEQLGGFKFEEKAIKEIKDKCRNTVYNDDKITVNKGKLSIANYVYFRESWGSGLELSWQDSKVEPLFNALSHYETDQTETLNYYNTIYKELKDGSKYKDIFSKYEIGYHLVKSMKFFKNGKIEIEFQSMQQAEEFKREYLNTNK